MPTYSYLVTGMTCAHCVASVTEELSALPGVDDVSVELASGRVTITAAQTLADSVVRTAVEEAGFVLAGST
jgi:copper chaperone CopZ